MKKSEINLAENLESSDTITVNHSASVENTELDTALGADTPEGTDTDTQNKAQDYIVHLQRLQAEFDNYRKRVNKEKENWYKQSVGGFIRKLLPVLADMERAFSQSIDPQNDLEKGLQMIFIKLREILQKEGLTEIQTLGQPFDPNLHDAMMIQEVNEGEDNRVINEYEKGYLFQNSVLRHARVGVSQRKSLPDSDTPASAIPDELSHPHQSASSFDKMA